MNRAFPVQPGSRNPPGVHADARGVNFCIFSRHASQVELLLYAHRDAAEPFQVVFLDPEINRTFFFWHVYVEGLPAGTHYTWRVDGPNDTRYSGFRFNKRKELSDPWARAVDDSHWDRLRASDPHDTSRSGIRAVVAADTSRWEGDVPINRQLQDCIIYEMHVGGFTRHASSGVQHPGTFLGLVEKIDYLKDLGITDIELLPVMAFDEQDIPRGALQRGLRNYWGYSTHSFFSPHPGYCVSRNAADHPDEFRTMIKALHRADIGVIMDVVYNHTSEGNHAGPTINFKGLVNEIFYHLNPEDRRRYLDFTGCGNTVNCNHPLVARFITASLSYWVRKMHIDGFRFDLASVFARGEEGEPVYNALLPWSIEFSRTLANTKIIAEAWDAAGLYQVGAFPGFRWAEWNGRYRDTLRRFLRGDKGIVSEVATCLGGSSDLYQPQGRLPTNSINFLTCHDGFTLHDLTAYHGKYNEANGENNADGSNDNFSWNCGHEGPTNDRAVIALRHRQAKNAMAMLLLSQGVPMILMGDEVLRSQRGNNNAYCQDNDISWFDWSQVEANRDMFRFVKRMIAFRKRHAALRRNRFLSGRLTTARGLPDIAWHGPRLGEPLWGDPDAQVLAFTLGGLTVNEEDIHVVMNMSDNRFSVPLPHVNGVRWFRAADTALSPPDDILEPHEQIPLSENSYTVQPRSVVVLEAR